MTKFTIGEIVEKLDRLGSLENKMRNEEALDNFDREDIADLLSEYADLLLGIKVEI